MQLGRKEKEERKCEAGNLRDGGFIFRSPSFVSLQPKP
jgi:hypothetical protein